MSSYVTAGIAALVIAARAGALCAQQPSDPAKLVDQVCSACHGPSGRSVSPAFPRLAGQQKDYIVNELTAFRSRTRADPMAQAYMWGMASQLSNDMIARVADYLSRQTPARGKAADLKLMRQGETIYAMGVPGTLVACQSCHGPRAEGDGMYPRLAGQHAEYLVKQLAMFKTQLRAGANARLMHAETADMTFDQMEAVAAYLSSR